MAWRVPFEWAGENVFILGGGKSLDLVDTEALRGRGRVIAINDAGLIRAPWADVHYWADAKWLRWNFRELVGFVGTYRVTRSVVPRDRCQMERKFHLRRQDADALWPAWSEIASTIRSIGRDRTAGLSGDTGLLAGVCSGSNAINLAHLFGASRIVLFGFDMRPGRWHDRHRTRSKPDIYEREFIPPLVRMAAELKLAGVEVVNASPGSALTCFPIVNPDEALRWSTSAR